MKRIAIIPARSGSKRIPDKNIKSFSNLPMLFWSIDSAIESDIFDRILVSTDSEKYAELARQRGAEVPFLRRSAYDDISTISLATYYALNQAKNYYQESYKTVVQLMPNCPLRKSQTIKNFVSSFESSSHTSLISACEYGWMNPNWAHSLNKNGVPVPLFPERIGKRSQDLPKLYFPTGSIWITNENNLLSTRNFYSKGWRFKVLPWDEAIDIDTEDDFKIAELIKNINLR